MYIRLKYVCICIERGLHFTLKILYFYQNVLFHPNGDDDEEDEQEGELGGDYVPVCYSSPRYKCIFFFLS